MIGGQYDVYNANRVTRRTALKFSLRIVRKRKFDVTIMTLRFSHIRRVIPSRYMSQEYFRILKRISLYIALFNFVNWRGSQSVLKLYCFIILLFRSVREYVT